MDDKAALVATIISGGALSLGLAAHSALFEYSQTKLEKMLKDGDRIAAVSTRLKDFSRLAFSLRLFNAFFSVFFAGSLLLQIRDDGGWLANFGELFAIWVIVGIGLLGILHGVAAVFAERIVLALLGFITTVARAMTPIIVPIELFSRWLGRLLGAETAATDEGDEALEEILDAVAEGEAEGALEEDAADYIENIMGFRERVVREVMTPRTSLVCARHDVPFDELLALLNEHGHSRVPVYGENRDHILGILYFKDALRRFEELRSGEVAIADILRNPLLVPETKKVSELLLEFKTEKVHIAIVLDEFGGTAGLITVEDILEEIVGEIEDEFDEAEDVNTVEQVDEHRVEVDAKIPIESLNEQLAIEVPVNGDYETVGGFLACRLGKVPETGERVEMEGLDFEVVDADERKAKRVRVTVTAAPEEGGIE